MIHTRTYLRFVKRPHIVWSWLLCCACCVLCGCGKTMQIAGTEQLLASDAVDTSIARIDFEPLRGQKVFFDTEYIKTIKGVGWVNADYITSALRQQILSHGCLLQEKIDTAEYVVEARVGALGGDQHDIIYGIPQNNGVSSVANLMPGTPPIPTIPEISLARKSHNSAAAKVAVFAYEKETRESIWQSGTSVATSNSKDTWLFGIGPFQSGTIYDGRKLAGEKIQAPWKKKKERGAPSFAYHGQRTFQQPKMVVAKEDKEAAETEKIADAKADDAKVKTVSHEEPAPEKKPAEEKPKPTQKLEGTSPESAKPETIKQAVQETIEEPGKSSVELLPPE